MLTIILGALLALAVIYILIIHFRRADGEIVITEDEGKKKFSLELAKNPDEMAKMKVIIFKVVHKDPDDLD